MTRRTSENRAVQTAVALICAMRDGDPMQATAILSALPRPELEGLAATLAGAMPDEQTIDSLRYRGAEIEYAALRRAHTAYAHGQRTADVIEGERAYQRHKAWRRRERRLATEREATA